MNADLQVEALVDQVAEVLRREIGLRPEPTLRGRLRRSLRDEALAQHLDPAAYVATMTTRPGALQGLVNRVTVQETDFFRHPEHFRVLAEILPTLTAPVTLWSAGCANGQEAYSLAIVLEELRIPGRVLATDMSTAALARTAEARYSTRETSGISPERRQRFLTHSHQRWELDPTVRSRVGTMQHNLIDPIPEAARRSQVVFCRNVLIYFSPDQATKFVTRVADAMPSAAVFLGSAEAMWPISARYATVHTGDTFYYRPTRHQDPGAAAPLPRTSTPAAGPPTARTGPMTAGPMTAGPARHGSAAPRPDGYLRPDVHPVPPAGVVRSTAPVTTADEPPDVAALTREGQQALHAGDHATAIVAFRKCAYLAPGDVLPHLHLGLAFEASGDDRAARRAFLTARRVLTARGPAVPDHALGGFATTELRKLLDAKCQDVR